MKSELKYLEKLASETLQPGKIEVDQCSYQEISDKVKQNKERVKNSFVNKIFLLRNEYLLEMFIQHHQLAIVRITDLLVDRFGFTMDDNGKLKEPEDLMGNLAHQVLQALEELLVFIQVYYPKYFNTTQKAPENYGLAARRIFNEKINELCEKYNTILETDLFKIATFPIARFVQKKKSPVSFSRLIFLRELLSEIENSCIKAAGDVTKGESLLINRLIYLNYNSNHFFKWLINYISSTIEQLDTIDDQIEKLSFYLKQINQAQMKPLRRFKSKRASIKILLTDWLSEELFFCEKRKQLRSKPASDTGNLLPEGFKVKTTYSVPQLAYHLRVLKEVGVIKNENIKEILHFYSAFMQTKNTANISPESLRIKFYNTEDSARRVVRETIIRMLNHTNKQLPN